MLPIDAIREEVVEAASRPGFCVLLSAPTGSGKSTQVPRMLLDAGCGERGCVLVVQPRRLAARLLASYVARCFPCPLGEEVGYSVRFDARFGKKTRILFTTDGVLERRLTEDALLEGVSAVVFDEVHERRLSGDLCLARVLELQRGRRSDLGVFVMSATLELDKLQGYLPQARVLRAEGRLFPVEVRYRPPVASRDARGVMRAQPVWEQCCEAVRELCESGDAGDVLVFLPGAYEIRRTVEILERMGWMRGRDVFPLHGQLSPEAQARAVERGERPRVIVATNIAETSLTIEGVRSVVDAGTAREARWDPQRGISTLHVVPISQAQAEQRAGRAGRLGPGRCVRLWSEAEQRRRPAFPSPEVHRADLSSAFLHLLAWGYRGKAGMMGFAWPDAPTQVQCDRAWELLEDLGAVAEDGGLSATGRALLRFPLPPVLAKLMLLSREGGCEAEAAAVCALLQAEPMAMGSGLSDRLREEGDYSDFQAEWRAVLYAARERFDAGACGRMGVMGRAAREVLAAFRQLMRSTPELHFESCREGLTRALLGAFPGNVAARNSVATGTARLTGRRSGRIAGDSVAKGCELFLAAEVTEVGGKSVETRLSRCTRLELGDVPLREERTARYEPSRRRVLAFRRAMYRDLVVVEAEAGDATPDEAAPLLADQVLRGHLVLEGWDGHVLQWIRRLHCLREAMPELELPGFEEEDRRVAVTMLCEGAVSYKEIRERPVLPILREWLSGWQRECLDRYAPRQLRLANGREVKLLYREDGRPVISLKCQQLFGVAETPVIAEGRVRCLVEVLAPNQRPYQVTDDLPSFWRNGYPQMKKDLAGRYPRHAWPDL